jgi:lipopolysaccharide export LptBFGC system permease protein LptF
MVTLHAYVLRELLKTFGLALAALTALFTMGGGLYNIVRYEGVSASDVFRFIPLLIPIVVTLTMPMAALFAATMVYGRLAADNELTACRAAGVNIHRIFLSALLLTLFVAAFSLLFGNFVIPSFIARISDFARSNLRDMVSRQLQHKGFIHRGKSGEDRYTLTAEKVQGVTDAALHAKGFETGQGLHYLLITNPTFLHLDNNGDLVRFTVARHGLCLFDTRRAQMEAIFFVHEARDFEVGKRAVYIGQQQVGPVKVPLQPRTRLSMAALDDLLRWRDAPWEVPRFSEDIRRFRTKLNRERFYALCAARLQDGKQLELFDDQGCAYRITCQELQGDDKGLTLTRARVAPSGELLIEIRLLRTADQDVLEYRPREGVYGEPRRQPTLSLYGPRPPAELVTEMQRYTPQAIVDSGVALPPDSALGDQHLGLQKSARRWLRKITATIHFRLGFASSVLVTVLMGAALGAIFRGSRALAAFALALIPFFSVLILLVLGRQLAEDQHAAPIGPLVTWGGLLLVLLADGLILRLGVRR